MIDKALVFGTSVFLFLASITMLVSVWQMPDFSGCPKDLEITFERPEEVR